MEYSFRTTVSVSDAEEGLLVEQAVRDLIEHYHAAPYSELKFTRISRAFFRASKQYDGMLNAEYTAHKEAQEKKETGVKIDSLGLSQALYRVLMRNRIEYVNQLKRLEEREIRRMRGLGPQKYAELMEAMGKTQVSE